MIMSSPLHLTLRNGHGDIAAIRRPHGPGLILARRHPDDESNRARILERWGWSAHSPRQQPLPTIDTPLSLRETIAVAAHFPRGLRDALNGAATAPHRGRREPRPDPLPSYGHDAVLPPETSPHRRIAHGVFAAADDPSERRARYVGAAPPARR